MTEVSVLDIGHGNCAIAQDDGWIVIVDTAPRNTLLQTLKDRGISEIDAVLLSHSDDDHVGGLVNLLSYREVHVRRVYLNSDARHNASWQSLRIALRDARLRSGLEIHAQLTSVDPGTLTNENLRVEVLFPTPELALSSRDDLQGHRTSANSGSAVVRILIGTNPVVLLPGDLDGIGLDNFLTEVPNPHASVLVFPHHGGRPGAANEFNFAKRLTEVVNPELVIFSIGRGAYGTPRPEIVAGVRNSAPRAHIACTQLSERCAVALPDSNYEHLNSRPARGRGKNACCAGTITVGIASGKLLCSPEPKQHLAFIRSRVPTPLCLGKVERQSRIDDQAVN